MELGPSKLRANLELTAAVVVYSAIAYAVGSLVVWAARIAWHALG